MKPHMIPQEFICPLTGKVMIDPVVIEGGKTFEKAAIQNHFGKVGAVDPTTKKVVRSVRTVSNLALQSLIRRYWTVHDQEEKVQVNDQNIIGGKIKKEET